MVASSAWVALTQPWLGIGLALLPLVGTVPGLDAPVHFGVVAGLCAVAVSAGWRRPLASVVAILMAEAVVVGWLFRPHLLMAAPFGAEIQHDFWSTGRAIETWLVYTIAFAVVLGVAFGLRVVTRTERERELLVSRVGQVEQQAGVVAERARLARDLHDVVAHHVSLIAVRAETAPYTHPDLADDARALLSDIAADARLALDELRGVLGILGRAGEDAQRAPQPEWADISALVERSRAAGLDVRLHGAVDAPVGPSSGYVAYRVVQEALTNARKHAPGAPAVVSLEVVPGLVVVRVASRLPQSGVAAGPGHGLAGMRERVEAMGGRLAAGPAGEFVVEATLPGASREVASREVAGVIRVVVADDQPVICAGFAALVDAQPDMTVVGTAHDGRQLVALVAAEHPTSRSSTCGCPSWTASRPPG